MGAGAQLPSDIWDQIRQIAAEEVAKYAASGPLRNATISDGGLTIQGGVFQALLGIVPLLYVGPIGPNLPDGTPQQGVRIRRGDGTSVLSMFDADTSDGVLRQALNWYDRSGNVVMADDTNSGQGLARPWLSGGFSRTRYADMSVSTTSSAFETLWDTRITNQQPRLEVAYRATMDTTATTGETRVMVNGVQLGTTASETFSIATRYAGPAVVAGAQMSDLVVELQGRRTSATGALRVEPLYWKGRQS